MSSTFAENVATTVALLAAITSVVLGLWDKKPWQRKVGALGLVLLIASTAFVILGRLKAATGRQAELHRQLVAQNTLLSEIRAAAVPLGAVKVKLVYSFDIEDPIAKDYAKRFASWNPNKTYQIFLSKRPEPRLPWNDRPKERVLIKALKPRDLTLSFAGASTGIVSCTLRLRKYIPRLREDKKALLIEYEGDLGGWNGLTEQTTSIFHFQNSDVTASGDLLPSRLPSDLEFIAESQHRLRAQRIGRTDRKLSLFEASIGAAAASDATDSTSEDEDNP